MSENTVTAAALCEHGMMAADCLRLGPVFWMQKILLPVGVIGVVGREHISRKHAMPVIMAETLRLGI